MARLCERPGCAQPAEVIFGIDADRLVVWLEGLDGNLVQRAGVLCRRHADSMVVPVGWMLDDRRTEVPRLFTPRTPTPVRHRPPRRPRAGGDDEPVVDEAPAKASQLALDMETEVAPPAQEAAVAPPPAWQPKFDRSDDLGGLLSANSPLLSRAFRLETSDATQVEAPRAAGEVAGGSTDVPTDGSDAP